MNNSSSYNQKFIPALGFNFLTDYYDVITRILMPSDFRHAIVSRIEAKNGEIILDFGAGTADTAILIKKFNPKTKVIGVDVDPKILRIATRKIAKDGCEIELVLNDKGELPFAENSIDKVASCLVFCSLNNLQKEKALTEIYRVLKAGGGIFITDWGVEKNLIKRVVMWTIHRLSPFRFINETSAQILKNLEAAGFKNVITFNSIKTITGTLNFYRATK